MPFIEPSRLEAKELLPGWNARFFHSAHMTFAYTEVAAGAGVHLHHHPEEEVWRASGPSWSTIRYANLWPASARDRRRVKTTSL
jgi:hypothetical protein